MQLIFDEAAKAKVQPFLAGNKVMLLDLDDGVGPYSGLGNCSLDTSFRLLIVNDNADIADYGGVLDSNLGTLHIKDYEYAKNYFEEDNRMILNPKNNRLVLKNDSNIIDSNVTILTQEQLVK